MEHIPFVSMAADELQAGPHGPAKLSPQVADYVDTGYVRVERHSYSRKMVRAPWDNVFAPFRRYYGGDEAMVYVPISVLHMVGSGDEAIILALLIDWCELPAPGLVSGANCVTGSMPKAPLVEDHWFVTTRLRLSVLTGLSLDKIKRSLARLRRHGLIFTRPSQYEGRNVLLIRLDAAFLADAESIQLGGVSVLAGMVRMTGSSNAAIVLGQIVYWHGSRRSGSIPQLRRHDDGHLWLAKEYRRLAGEIGLKVNQVKLAVKQLKVAGAKVSDRTPCLEARVQAASAAKNDDVVTDTLDQITHAGCADTKDCVMNLLWVAGFEQNRGKPLRALVVLERAHERDADDDDLLGRIAALATSVNLHAEALHAYEELARHHPKDARYTAAAAREKEALLRDSVKL